MNKRGFLLLDALLNVFVVSIIVSLCLYVYEAINYAQSGFNDYLANENDSYEQIFNSLSECEACFINESD